MKQLACPRSWQLRFMDFTVGHYTIITLITLIIMMIMTIMAMLMIIMIMVLINQMLSQIFMDSTEGRARHYTMINIVTIIMIMTIRIIMTIMAVMKIRMIMMLNHYAVIYSH